MNQEQLNVGVIGIGGISRTHLPGWVASEHARVVAGADLNGDALSAWGTEHGVPKDKQYSDAAGLLADDSVDVVDICVPSGFHADLTISALRAGKHVLCEKPLASSAEQIERVIVARDESGKLLMTGQNMRFTPESIAAKCAVEDGRLGEVYHARGWWLRRGEVPTGPGFVYRKNSGGGPCIDLGVHYLDLMLWLMNHPEPTRVSGTVDLHLANQPRAYSDWGGGLIPSDIDVEDFAAGFIRFANGATLILEVSWMLHHPREENGVWLYGTQGGLHLPSARLFRSNNEQRTREDIQLRPPAALHGSHAAECIAFAKAIANGEPSPVPAEQSLKVQRIIDALYASQAAGSEIELT